MKGAPRGRGGGGGGGATGRSPLRVKEGGRVGETWVSPTGASRRRATVTRPSLVAGTDRGSPPNASPARPSLRPPRRPGLPPPARGAPPPRGQAAPPPRRTPPAPRPARP